MELYNTPANLFVAGFIGSPAMNFIQCSIAEENSTVYVRTTGFKISLPEDLGAKTKSSGLKDFILGIRPEDINKRGMGEATARKSEPVKAHVNVIETLGKETCLDLTAGDENMTAIVSPNTPVALNDDTDLEMNMDKVHLFKKDDGQAIF